MSFTPMFKRTLALMLAMLAVLLIGLVVISGQLRAQDDPDTPTTRIYDMPDLGSITYPLATYSVRNWFSGVPDELAQQITFPGVITLDPNDSLIYGEEPGNVYRIRLASVVRDEDFTAQDLPVLLGTLPLAQYTPDMMGDHPVVNFTLDGKPAVRVNDLPVGQYGLAAHIIALNGHQLLEIIVEPVTLVENADAKVQVERRKLYEDMIASFQWLEMP